MRVLLRRARRLGLSAGLLILALTARPHPALACTPPPGGLPSYTATDRAQAAPLILQGTVMAVQAGFPEVAVVQVSQYLKGIGPQLVAISGFGPSSMCLSEVSAGQSAVFYVSGDEAAGYRAFYLSQFDAVAPDDAQTVAAITAASGQPPRTDFTPYQAGTPDAVLTQVQATAATPTTPTPIPGPAVRPPIPLPAATALPPDLSLVFLGVGGVLGFLAGVVVGLLAGFLITALLRRGE